MQTREKKLGKTEELPGRSVGSYEVRDQKFIVALVYMAFLFFYPATFSGQNEFALI